MVLLSSTISRLREKLSFQVTASSTLLKPSSWPSVGYAPFSPATWKPSIAVREVYFSAQWSVLSFLKTRLTMLSRSNCSPRFSMSMRTAV